MTSHSLPLRDGVPYWAGVSTVMLIMLMTTMANGTNIGIVPYFVGSLSAISDDIQMGYYSAAVGSCIGIPLIPKLNVIYTPKTLLLGGLAVEVVLNMLCAVTQSIDILIVASFLSGIAKGILVMTCIPLVRHLLSPKDDQHDFVCWLFVILLSGGQVSTMLTAYLTERYQWQYIYYVITGLCLISIALILLLFKYAMFPLRFPWRKVDIKAIFLVAVAWLSAVFVFSYGEHLDWFSSDKIKMLALLFVVLTVLFLIRNYTAGQRFVYFKPLLRREGLIGYTFTFLTVFFTSTGVPMSSYLNIVIGVDNIHSNLFNLWFVPGFCIGAYLCAWWFRHHYKIERLISLAIMCYVGYLAMAYFGVSVGAEYDALWFANVLRGAGMMMLFSGIVLYIMEELAHPYRPSHVFWLLSIRSAIGPVMWGAFFSYTLYIMTTEGMTVLGGNMSLDNYIAAPQYASAVNSHIAQGYSMEDATSLAVNSFYNQLYQQATLLAVKRQLGYLLICSAVLAVITFFIPFQNHAKEVRKSLYDTKT